MVCKYSYFRILVRYIGLIIISLISKLHCSWIRDLDLNTIYNKNQLLLILEWGTWVQISPTTKTNQLLSKSDKKKKKHNYKRWKAESLSHISKPGFDLGTCGLWAHHASAAPLWFVAKLFSLSFIISPIIIG